MKSLHQILTVSIISIAILFAGQALAEQPDALGNTEAVVIYTPDNLAPLSIEEGQMTSCEKNESLVIFTCQLQNAWLNFRTDAGMTRIALDEVIYMQSEHRDVTYYEYIYSAQWSKTAHGITIDTPVRVSMQYNSKNPQNLFGHLQLKTYKQSYQLKGRRQ